MSKKKKRVANAKIPKKNVKTQQPNEDDRIYIDFTQYGKWTDTISMKEFTNNLKDVEEAFRHFGFILKHLLKYIENNGKNILSNNVKHCHSLTGDARKLAVKVAREIHGSNILDEDTNLWQLAVSTEEIRIVGTFVEKTFYPLFIDHHHLIYPSQKYNQADYKHYKYVSQEHLKN